MKKLADFLVDRRYVVLAVMLMITVVCAVLWPMVETNTDMSRYLSKHSPMREGIAVQEAAFPDSAEVAAYRFAFRNLPDENVAEVLSAIQGHVYVANVEYEAGNPHYNRDGMKLFVVTTKYGYDDSRSQVVRNVFQRELEQYDLTIRSNETQKTDVPFGLLCIGVAMVVAVLLVMSRSWFEPVLFLVTVGIAVLINLGTNLILGYTSDITVSIGPVLQLVLSMDYSIILMNRFREEKPRFADKRDAMKAALAGAFSSIASSSLTTVVGLLALVFMTYKIGMELGIVLAKGVFISMICVFTILPSLILWGDGLVEKTAKKSIPLPTDGLARMSDRGRKVIPILFVLLFAGFAVWRTFTPIIFTECLTDDLSDTFPADNTVVLLYETADEAAIAPLVEELEADENVRAVSCYQTSFGRQLTMEQLGEAVSRMGGSMSIPEDILRRVFDAAESDTVSIETAVWLLANDPRFADVFGSGTESLVGQMQQMFWDAADQMRGPEYSRLVIYTLYPEDSEETTAFMDRLYAHAENDFAGRTWLIGTSAMVHEMASTFQREFLTVSVITALAIFLVVLLTFRNGVIPILLVLLVQCGVYMAITAMGWQGYDVYYLALLVVQGILMGATIDYAIVFSSNYRELRMEHGRAEALRLAYRGSIHTIMTSGLILIVVTAILGAFCPTQSIAQVCTSIALGTTSAVLLILLILPGLLAFCDRWVVKKGTVAETPNDWDNVP